MMAISTSKWFLIGVGIIVATFCLSIFLGKISPWVAREQVIYDAELRLTDQHNAIVGIQQTMAYVNDQLLSYLHKSNNGEVRATVAIMTSNLNSVPVLIRFSIINSVTLPGHKPSVVVGESLPIFEWRDYLTNMVHHKCTFILTSDLTDLNAKGRISSFAYKVLACPIYSVNGKLIGNLTTSWDDAASLPTPDKTAAMIENATKEADIIGNYLTKDLVR